MLFSCFNASITRREPEEKGLILGHGGFNVLSFSYSTCLMPSSFQPAESVADDIALRLREIESSVPEKVRLVAVTKTFPSSDSSRCL